MVTDKSRPAGPANLPSARLAPARLPLASSAAPPARPVPASSVPDRFFSLAPLALLALATLLAMYLFPVGSALADAAGHSADLAADHGGSHGADSLHLDGASLAIWWVLPFVGMLLSIALFPLIAPHFWEHNFGKVALFWAAAFFVPAVALLGGALSFYSLVHTVVAEYIPFIILLLALFAIAGGIRVKGSLSGTPAMNLAFLVIGSVLASVMGTTGASMLLIRPYIAASAHRRYRVHTIVFFIFLVSNIGGSLTPLGDPPLFLGFLKGVTFFWTTTHIWVQTLCMEIALLAIHYVVDSYLYKREGSPTVPATEKIGLEGSINFLLLAAVVGLVLLSGLWHSQGQLVVWKDITYLFSDITRDVGLLILTFLTVFITPKATREGNNFTWGPIKEVAKIFFGIFITMIPAIAILRAGVEGELASLISLVSTATGDPVDMAYFFLTGALSSFLDNAPTYLVFFNTAAGSATDAAGFMMNQIPQTLAAISCGAVFMGANSYIGNAPNFMVRSIAEERGVKMPSFFGYLLWSVGILVPLFIVLAFVFF